MGLLKNVHVYLTFHHGFVVLTIMENRGNTEWGYEEKHSCLFNIPSHGFVVFTTMENKGNTEWDYEKTFMSIQHSIMVLQHLPSWKIKVT